MDQDDLERNTRAMGQASPLRLLAVMGGTVAPTHLEACLAQHPVGVSG